MGAAEQDAERKFLFLLASAREGGNTEELARRAAEGLPEGAAQEWLRLKELPLPPFEDNRHTGTGQYPEPGGNARLLLDATLAASDLVIASPLYWYSVSTSAKLYLEHWSAWMRVPGLDFRARMAGKTMWAVTVLASEDRSKADPLVGTLRNCAEFLGMRWGGTLLGNGSAPGQVLTDSVALADAVTFFAGRFPAAVLPVESRQGPAYGGMSPVSA
ncbi:NAD(P)H-dependent oxidoreductase [Streptomyces sp. NPDC006923]|uniref:flavodoxin family protein n=1 Tax=Streptomyces sp. NPDC006923 TaxID=3155355 RepID=UPI0033E40DB6